MCRDDDAVFARLGSQWRSWWSACTKRCEESLMDHGCMPIIEARRRSLIESRGACALSDRCSETRHRDTPTKTLAHALSTSRARQTGKRPPFPPITLFTRFLARLLTFLLHSSLCRPLCKYPNTILVVLFIFPLPAVSHRQQAASARAAAAASAQPALPHRHPSLCIRYTVPGASKVEHFDFTMMAPTASS